MKDRKSRFQSGSQDEGLREVLQMDLDCVCGRHHAVGTRHVIVKRGAALEIPRVLRDLGLVGKVAVCCDKVVRPIAEEKVLPALEAGKIRYETVCVDKPGEVEADLTTARELMDNLPAGTDVLMTVGSGTMNDLSKYAAAVKGLPYLVVATAPSMNGYTSSITALTAGKYKTTQETVPAAAVIADVDIMKDAPVEMIRAGLGDLVSKWVCNADWKMSHLVRKTYFCDVPFEMIRGQEEYYMDHAAELGRGDEQAVKALTEAIMISGFSMAIVGTSSPSSGSEHLVSHVWEMKDHLEGRKSHLHGAQVGVGTVLMAKLYEVVSAVEPGSIDVDRAVGRYPKWEEVERRVKEFYGEISPEVLESAKEKHPNERQLELELEWVLGNWKRMWSQLKKYRKSSKELVRALGEAGTPTKPIDLGIDAERTLSTILNARYMRNRYTVLDLAESMGILEDVALKVVKDLSA